MEDLIRYLDEIVEPTFEDFLRNPLSVRHAFIACVATFHAIDYLAYPKSSRTLRQQFGRQSADFKLVDQVAHAFKHVVSGNPQKPTLKSNELVKRTGVFSPGVFSARVFDVGAVAVSGRPEVNMLKTVERAIEFLRQYRPPEENRQRT